MKAVVILVAALVACSSPADEDWRCAYRPFLHEVGGMFAELQVKEEGEKVVRGEYVPLSVFPTTASAALPPDWVALRILLPNRPPRDCTYSVEAGGPQTAGALPACALRAGIPAHPTAPWFCVSATCRSPGTVATYWTTSLDRSVHATAAAALARTHARCASDDR